MGYVCVPSSHELTDRESIGNYGYFPIRSEFWTDKTLAD